ncbi:deoxynucleoside triphosphate triphosphohydrolase SAMHD1-like [Ptychodera flava]|uniref:deoxynucleoside triphosphate triphosphohydrolase SAMHD1-like n=1 Tax=Ptychodera flava TaxID=63121 RepID=UPI00396A4CE2
MIYGPLKIGTSGYHEATDNKYKAKYRRRYFLYEIVSNSINQIDVNKWDHLARDSYHLGVPCSFIHDRLLKFTKVLKDRKDQQKTHIGFRDKEASSVLEMFHTKYKLFRMARYHPVTIGMEAMIADALSAAVDHIKLTKSDGSTVSIPDAVTDMYAYRQLDDNILTLILHSYSNENLKESRQILERMQRRDIYKCIKRIPVKRGANEHEDEIRTEIVAGSANEGHLKANDLYVKVIELDYGMKDRNPLDSVLFFSKDKPDEPKSFSELQEQVSLLAPKTFEERLLFIYVKDKKNRSVAVDCIDQWVMKSPWVHEDVGTAKTPQDVMMPTTPPPVSQTGMPRPPSKRRGPPGENDEPEGAKKKLFSESE